MSATTGRTPEGDLDELAETLIARTREHFLQRINEILIDGVEAARRNADEESDQHGFSLKRLHYMRGYVDALSDARVAVTRLL